MKIVRTFEDILADNSPIWGCVFAEGHKDEYNRLMDLWHDPEYLEDFFERYKDYLNTDFWKHMSVEEAVNETLNEVKDFDDMIYELACGRKWGDKESLFDVFSPLYKQDAEGRHDNEFKGKSEYRPPFLRLYGIALEDGTIIVTGGGIKLSDTMQDSPGMENDDKKLKDELKKNERTKTYCKENGITFLHDLTTD